MNERPLPLFPLQVVLFPGSSLPLHIFEVRYKTLIGEVIDGTQEFGINLVTDKQIAEIGCTATVAQVLMRYDDGRMDIIVEGRRRYRVERYDSESAPYLTGWVTFLPTSNEEPKGSLSAETIVLYNQLITRVYKGRVSAIDETLRRESLSFLLAQKAGLDLARRQMLLEMDSENERLRMLRQYLQEVIPKLDQLEEVERVVRSDGYL
jgi:Lon protease-like protein